MDSLKSMDDSMDDSMEMIYFYTNTIYSIQRINEGVTLKEE